MKEAKKDQRIAQDKYSEKELDIEKLCFFLKAANL